MLPIFNIGGDFYEDNLPGKLMSKNPHDKSESAEVYTIEITDGDVLLTVMGGMLHEVIYQTPKLFSWSKKRKNKHLFSCHFGENDWVEMLDNGFGKTYRSKSGEMYALWSYPMDYNTYGAIEFHCATLMSIQ